MAALHTPQASCKDQGSLGDYARRIERRRQTSVEMGVGHLLPVQPKKRGRLLPVPHPDTSSRQVIPKELLRA